MQPTPHTPIRPPVRLALLSFWHVHAGDYAREATHHPDVELAAIWDEDPERGRAEAAARGVPFVADLEAIWNDPGIHGVILTSATSEHLRLLTAAARAGKHVYTEKVIAATAHDARAAADALGRAGVAWMVSLPRLYTGPTLAIRDAIQSGRLGRITQVRARVSHSGVLPTPDRPNGWLPERFLQPQGAQGGAMIDFGVHPMYLTRLFLGMPDRVTASYGRVFGHAVEDNAVALLHHPSGALGIVEVGFVNPGNWFSLEVHGTEALLHYGSPTGNLSVTDAHGWQTLEVPADEQGPFDRWVEHLVHPSDDTGAALEQNQRIALELSALMEAANEAARTGQTVSLAP